MTGWAKYMIGWGIVLTFGAAWVRYGIGSDNEVNIILGLAGVISIVTGIALLRRKPPPGG